jgi:hypothetical protein
MKKIILSLAVLFTATIVFWACKDNAASTEPLDTAIPEVSIAEATEQFNARIAAGSIGVGMNLNSQGRSPKCIPCGSWSGCICSRQSCDIVKNPTDFWLLKETGMSLTTFEVINPNLIEVIVVALDAETQARIKSGKVKDVLYLSEDIPMDSNLTMALKLKASATMPAGQYAIVRSKEAPLGKIAIKVRY